MARRGCHEPGRAAGRLHHRAGELLHGADLRAHGPDSAGTATRYLQALRSLPLVKIHYGSFQVAQKWAGLVQPSAFRPVKALPPRAAPQVAYVGEDGREGIGREPGVHLVRDAFKGAFDLAAVLTNDTDLVEPVRIVTQELGLSVTLLPPSGQPAGALINAATSLRHLRPYVGPCQMPDQITLANGRKVKKPVGW